jgi:hypothetical protein
MVAILPRYLSTKSIAGQTEARGAWPHNMVQIGFMDYSKDKWEEDKETILVHVKHKIIKRKNGK